MATPLAGLCISNISVAVAQTTEQISAAKDILAKTSPAELPSKAAQLVVNAPAKQKAAVASAVGQAVASLNPDMAPAAVAAITAKVPVVAPAAAAAAAGKLPGSAPAIAVAAASVPGVNAAEVRAAVIAAAPKQEARITSALSRAKLSSSPVAATQAVSAPAKQAETPRQRQPVATPLPAAVSAPGAESSKEALDIPSLEIPKPIATRNEISVSGDFLYGQGSVTFPFGFSLAKGGSLAAPFVDTPDRKSDYIGGTISYSFGQAWYFDVSYAHGNSSGNFNLPSGGGDSKFTIDDDWYQGYVRYTFPALRGTRFSAYLRAGISYVQADLNDKSDSQGLYEQTDRIKDILGNAGFGLGYSLFSGSRLKTSLQLEGEGFYGHRSQDSRELLGGGANPSASIDNDLYGGIGRSTVRFEYHLGRSGLFKLFTEGGMEVKYTRINYADFGIGTLSELLWGPYAKFGVRYSF